MEDIKLALELPELEGRSVIEEMGVCLSKASTRASSSSWICSDVHYMSGVFSEEESSQESAARASTDSCDSSISRLKHFCLCGPPLISNSVLENASLMAHMEQKSLRETAMIRLKKLSLMPVGRIDDEAGVPGPQNSPVSTWQHPIIVDVSEVIDPSPEEQPIQLVAQENVLGVFGGFHSSSRLLDLSSSQGSSQGAFGSPLSVEIPLLDPAFSGDFDDHASDSSSDLFELESLVATSTTTTPTLTSARSSIDPDEASKEERSTQEMGALDGLAAADGPRTYLIVYSISGKRAKVSSSSSWKTV